MPFFNDSDEEFNLNGASHEVIRSNLVHHIPLSWHLCSPKRYHVARVKRQTRFGSANFGRRRLSFLLRRLSEVFQCHRNLPGRRRLLYVSCCCMLQLDRPSNRSRCQRAGHRIKPYLEYGDWYTVWKRDAAAQRRTGLNWWERLARMNATISALGVAILKRRIHQQYRVRFMPLPTMFPRNTITTAVQFASRSLA